MNYSEASKAHGLYLCGLSLQKVADRIGITRQLLHYYFKQFNLSTRKLKKQKVFTSNGFNYTPDKDGFLRKTVGDRSYLHRYNWESKNGKIPSFQYIIFKDDIKTNCDISNLLLVDKVPPK